MAVVLDLFFRYIVPAFDEPSILKVRLLSTKLIPSSGACVLFGPFDISDPNKILFSSLNGPSTSSPSSFMPLEFLSPKHEKSMFDVSKSSLNGTPFSIALSLRS